MANNFNINDYIYSFIWRFNNVTLFYRKKYYTSKKTKRIKWGKLLLDSLKFCALLLFASMGVFGGAGVTLNL